MLQEVLGLFLRLFGIDQSQERQRIGKIRVRLEVDQRFLVQQRDQVLVCCGQWRDLREGQLHLFLYQNHQSELPQLGLSRKLVASRRYCVQYKELLFLIPRAELLDFVLLLDKCFPLLALRTPKGRQLMLAAPILCVECLQAKEALRRERLGSKGW